MQTARVISFNDVKAQQAPQKGLTMDQIKIKGGHRLNGEITISGAKNAALPLLCTGLLTEGTVNFLNMPVSLGDIKTLSSVLA